MWRSYINTYMCIHLYCRYSLIFWRKKLFKLIFDSKVFLYFKVLLVLILIFMKERKIVNLRKHWVEIRTYCKSLWCFCTVQYYSTIWSWLLITQLLITIWDWKKNNNFFLKFIQPGSNFWRVWRKIIKIFLVFFRVIGTWWK